MKLLMLATLFCSSSAFATKARLTALGNGFHLRSSQSVFTTVTHIHALEPFFALESGTTSPATAVTSGSTAAEAGIMTNIGDDGAKLLFAVGHIDESIQIQRGFANAFGAFAFKTQQNPIQLIYGWKSGENTFGAGAFYSNFNNKTVGAEEKESSTGLRLAGGHGAILWRTNLGLSNTAENPTNKLTGKPYMNIAGRYTQGSTRYGLDYTTWGIKIEDVAGTAVQEHEYSNILARVSTVTKTDVAEWFYSAGISQTDLKDKLQDKKMSRLALPVLIAVESKASEWLTLRGSITQTVFVAQSKDERGYPLVNGVTNPASGTPDQEFGAEANNTSVAVGAGAKFGQATIDGTIRDLSGSAAGQKIDGSNLLAQVGFVYHY